MSEPNLDRGPDELRQQMQEAIAQASISPAMRKRKLLLWSVRQVLLCALAWYFWDSVWMRWVFWVGVGIALINLAMILLMPRFLAGQQHKGNTALDRLERLGRNDAGDRQVPVPENVGSVVGKSPV